MIERLPALRRPRGAGTGHQWRQSGWRTAPQFRPWLFEERRAFPRRLLRWREGGCWAIERGQKLAALAVEAAPKLETQRGAGDATLG